MIAFRIILCACKLQENTHLQKNMAGNSRHCKNHDLFSSNLKCLPDELFFYDHRTFQFDRIRLNGIPGNYTAVPSRTLFGNSLKVLKVCIA